MAEDRLTHALPLDVARLFDSTVSSAQLTADTFQNSPDDVDLLASMIEDAEAEFHERTDAEMRVGRQGVEGQRESYEQTTSKISGHKLAKGTFSGVWSNYLPEEKEMMLEQGDILPFDSAEGDEVYIYRGLQGNTASRWEDVTDQRGEMWDILDNRSGRFVFSPIETASYVLDSTGGIHGSFPSFLKRMRFAISYRYGALGGNLGRPAQTDLAAGLTDTETGTVAVSDGTGFPSGDDTNAIVVLIGREYLRVVPDPANDQMDIVERGVRGTGGASHSTGDRVQYTPPSVRKAIASRAGMQLVTSGRYSDWLPDTEDSLDKSDVLDQFESTWTQTVEALSS